jgi:hypothetical protein
MSQNQPTKEPGRNSTLSEHKSYLSGQGFEKAWSGVFEIDPKGGRLKEISVWAHTESGLLLILDSYDGTPVRVNSAFLDYELSLPVSRDKLDESQERTLSGLLGKASYCVPVLNGAKKPVAYVLSCKFNSGQDLPHYLRALSSAEGFGTNNPWEHYGRHVFHLTTSREFDDTIGKYEARKKIVSDRIAQFPLEVRVMIGAAEPTE